MTDLRKGDGLPEEMLDALFSSARTQQDTISDTLMARIMADAEAETEARTGAERAALEQRRAAAASPALKRRGFFGGLAGAFGGFGHGNMNGNMSGGGTAVSGGAGQLVRTIGGIPALAGLLAATVAGVWIGVVQPAGLSDSMSSFFGTSSAATTDMFDIYYVENGSVFDLSEPEG